MVPWFHNNVWWWKWLFLYFSGSNPCVLPSNITVSFTQIKWITLQTQKKLINKPTWCWKVNLMQILEAFPAIRLFYRKKSTRWHIIRCVWSEKFPSSSTNRWWIWLWWCESGGNLFQLWAMLWGTADMIYSGQNMEWSRSLMQHHYDYSLQRVQKVIFSEHSVPCSSELGK